MHPPSNTLTPDVRRSPSPGNNTAANNTNIAANTAANNAAAADSTDNAATTGTAIKGC